MPKNQSNQENKIKIVYVIPTLDPGGAERFLVDLILNLDRNIYEPTLILFKRGGLWLKELEEENISVITLNKKYLIDFANFLGIIRNLKKIKPLIVHTQLGGDLYGRLAAKILNIPIIISTEQNLNPDEKFVPNIIKKITSKTASKIVAISEAVKNDIIKRYKISADRVIIIYNGLNIDKFLNFNKEIKTTGSEPRKIILGTIGRLSTQKGHSVLINALARIKDLNFEFRIVGAGFLENSLNKQIENLGLNDKVKLIGTVKDTPAFLDSLDAFVFPSLWEGQGIVLMEAALMGLPIIASDVDGIKEVLSQENAYLVKAGDEKDLADKITWLLNNIDSAPVKERSLRLKNEIINKFSITKTAEEYQKLYQDLLKTYENTTS
jgi:glycosyltransferase involved in cell wall biosynthesis